MVGSIPKLGISRIAGDDSRPISNTRSSGQNALDVNVTGPLSAFGDLRVVEPIPIISIDATYGLRTKTDVEVFTNATGTNTSDENGGGRQFKCETGTNAFGYGLIRSQRAAKYHAGQGIDFKFTALFTQGVTLSAQRAGGIDVGAELSVGYDGTTFGFLHRRNGRIELRRMTVTTGAVGNETATITLNGTAFTVSLTASGITHSSFQLGAASYTGYVVHSTNDEVTWVANSVGDQTGVFSVTTTGALVGTINELRAGQAVEDNFISQTAWNVNTFLDSASSFVLDSTKGNVFNIKFQYLGYGAITLGVEDPVTGHFVTAHNIAYANTETIPSMEFPIYKMGVFAANLGNTTNLITKMASASAQREGLDVPSRNPEAHLFTQLSIGTTMTNVLSVRNTAIFNASVNLHEIIPLLATVSVDGTKSAEIVIFLNPVYSGEPNFVCHDEGNSAAEIMTTKVTISEGPDTSELVALALGKVASDKLNLADLGILVLRNQTICIAVRATSSTTDATAGLTWREE